MSDDLKRWQIERHAELSSPDSWLGLVGLFWLQPGLNPVGSSAAATVVLSEGPALLGDLYWEGRRILWRPGDGPEVALATDLHGAPTTADLENLSFFVVDRNGQLAVRIRDRNWADKAPFAGVDYFPFDRAWQIVATWQAIDPPLTMEVPNVSGDLKTVSVAHRAVFEQAGQTVSLLPMSVGEQAVFFVFRDRSSGRETYGAGRFLKVPPPTRETTAGPGGGDKITLDFNRAYNPPCAFTPFATCPLPPPENWLPFAVPAGEKKWLKPT